MIAFVGFDSFTLWQAALLLIVQCCFAFSVAVITHNTVHVPMFESARLNHLAQLTISFLYGNPVSVFVRGHNYSHHRYTQTPRDLMRTTKARFRWNLLNQVLFLLIVAPAIERSNKIFIAKERELDTRWYRQLRLERIVVFGGTLILFLIDWRASLIFVMIPRLFGLWCICGVNYVQHDGCDQDHRYNHSRNLVGPYINWFLFNNGYHGLHHDHPEMHWSLLPEVHEREIAPHIHPALDVKWAALYLFNAYIYPGRRMRYDGKPVVLGPPVPDEDWLPTTLQMSETVSIGAAGTLPDDEAALAEAEAEVR